MLGRLSIALAVVAGLSQTPQIPRTWDERAMAAFELPVADPAVKRAHISADYCYALPERVIYYVPTGVVGHNRKTRAVKGHPFGLVLGADDKRALIAFLKTL